MSEEKSSPIGIIIIVFVAAVFVGCESNNHPETTNKNEQPAAKPAEPAKPKAPVFDSSKNDHRLIEAKVRRRLNKPGGALTVEDLAKVKDLHYYKGQISDLSALKNATGLERLLFPLNHISDLAPLSGLKNLNFLELNRNRISDLTPLAGLTNLKSLDLAANQITDLTSLAGLKQLTTLSLLENPKLTRAQIDELQKALPNCVIHHDAK